MENDDILRIDPEALIELMKNYELPLEKEYVLHHYVCDNLNKTEKRIGILMIVLNAFATGTFLQIFLSDTPPAWLIRVPIVCSIVAIILASLVTFMDYRSRAQAHHNAASNFGHLLYQCRAYLADPQIKNLSPDELKNREKDIADRMFNLRKDSPPIPGNAYSNVDKLIEKEEKLHERLKQMREKRIS